MTTGAQKKAYPCETHSHPYAIAEHRIKDLSDANRTLREENEALKERNRKLEDEVASLKAELAAAWNCIPNSGPNILGNPGPNTLG